MIKNKRGSHQDCSDQELIDLFRQLKDRHAVAELYERYRGLLGNYLSRDIKNKTAVANSFNTMMFKLLTNSSSQISKSKVSIKLFAMAYAIRLDYLSEENQENLGQAAQTSTLQSNALENRLRDLPRLHRDVLELSYTYNFAFDETAEIIGCTSSVVSNCLLCIKQQQRSFSVGSNTRPGNYLSHTEPQNQHQIGAAS